VRSQKVSIAMYLYRGYILRGGSGHLPGSGGCGGGCCSLITGLLQELRCTLAGQEARRTFVVGWEVETSVNGRILQSRFGSKSSRVLGLTAFWPFLDSA
jgi:hypothetical protein